MGNEAKLFIGILVIIAVVTTGYKFYKAYKNDGKITKEEVVEIIFSIRMGVLNIFEQVEKLNEAGKVGPDGERDYVKEQLINGINKSTTLTEGEKGILTRNMDFVLDFILNNKDQIKESEAPSKELLEAVESKKLK